MTAITLGFKAFDAHELLCHFVADETGRYRQEGIEVELADITFVADDALPADWFQASCGAALTSAVRGLDQRVLFVAVDRPMFWLWTREPVAGLDELRGQELATFPPQAPPHNLARVIFRRAGIDPDTELRARPARDDVARLGLLRSGSVAAAVISSALSPARLRSLGLHDACFFGDALRLPTTGLATSGRNLDASPALAATLAAIHRESLGVIHDDPELTAAVLRDRFDVEPAFADATARLFSRAFTRDGRTTEAIAVGAIEAIASALGIAERPGWDAIYAFD